MHVSSRFALFAPAWLALLSGCATTADVDRAFREAEPS